MRGEGSGALGAIDEHNGPVEAIVAARQGGKHSRQTKGGYDSYINLPVISPEEQFLYGAAPPALQMKGHWPTVSAVRPQLDLERGLVLLSWEADELTA